MTQWRKWHDFQNTPTTHCLIHQRCVMKPQDQRTESRMSVAWCVWVGEEEPSMKYIVWRGKCQTVRHIKWSANASTINTFPCWKGPAIGNVLDNVACTRINTHTLYSCCKESILNYIFYAPTKPGSLHILDFIPLLIWRSSRSFILHIY